MSTGKGFKVVRVRSRVSVVVDSSDIDWRKLAFPVVDWGLKSPTDPEPDPEPEPKNNDGRDRCFWCSGPTKSVGITATLMQVCTGCGR